MALRINGTVNFLTLNVFRGYRAPMKAHQTMLPYEAEKGPFVDKKEV